MAVDKARLKEIVKSLDTSFKDIDDLFQDVSKGGAPAKVHRHFFDSLQNLFASIEELRELDNIPWR